MVRALAPGPPVTRRNSRARAATQPRRRTTAPPRPQCSQEREKRGEEGRKGREHNAPSFSASTFHHSFRGLRVTNVGSVDTLYSPNLEEEEGENGRSDDATEGGRFNLASRNPDDDRRRLHHTTAHVQRERDEILKCVTVAAAAAVEVW